MKKFRQYGKVFDLSDPEWEYNLKKAEYDFKYKNASRYNRSSLTREWNELKEEKGWV